MSEHAFQLRLFAATQRPPNGSLRKLTAKKREAHPARVAKVGQENIETVHKPKPIQAADTLWGQGRRAMKDLYGPRTRGCEGACAIKVSMRCSVVRACLLYRLPCARTTL